MWSHLTTTKCLIPYRNALQVFRNSRCCFFNTDHKQQSENLEPTSAYRTRIPFGTAEQGAWGMATIVPSDSEYTAGNLKEMGGKGVAGQTSTGNRSSKDGVLAELEQVKALFPARMIEACNPSFVQVVVM